MPVYSIAADRRIRRHARHRAAYERFRERCFKRFAWAEVLPAIDIRYFEMWVCGFDPRDLTQIMWWNQIHTETRLKFVNRSREMRIPRVRLKLLCTRL